MLEKLNETVRFLQERMPAPPATGIVLGSGLGGLADHIEKAVAIPYTDIPHFPVSTVAGHRGNLLFGTLAGTNVVALQGRFHFYEGYSMQDVTFPVRVMQRLGIGELILSNASGGVNPAFRTGDLMIIEDHINLMGANPLTGPNDERLGPRFPDMSAPYDADRIRRAQTIAGRHGFRCHTGVYAAVTGPCYETPAEYRYIRILGADAVGMSTVPEAIVARHMNLPCFAVSVITDLGGDGMTQEVTHEEVVKIAGEAGERLVVLIGELIAKN